TTNALYLTDRQGLPLAISTPVAGNHHDLYNIEKSLNELFTTLDMANINTDGLFVNPDSGFDSKKFRKTCHKHGVFANVDFNYRNGEIDDDKLLDEFLYKERSSIERTNAWIDSFRTLINRFDTTLSSWLSFNYISFMVILLRKINKNKKYR
ncbi:hypothetical protein EZS27_042407, partial [termite gut metagenome]